MTKRWAIALILLFAFGGIAVSTYIEQSEKAGAPLICNIGSLDGCNVVVTSEYANFLGVSLATWGMLFYTIVFVLAAFELAYMNQILRRMLQGLGLIGLLVSLYGLSTQIFIIKELCIYCLVSLMLAIGIFIAATFVEPISFGALKQRIFKTT